MHHWYGPCPATIITQRDYNKLANPDPDHSLDSSTENFAYYLPNLITLITLLFALRRIVTFSILSSL